MNEGGHEFWDLVEEAQANGVNGEFVERGETVVLEDHTMVGCLHALNRCIHRIDLSDVAEEESQCIPRIDDREAEEETSSSSL